MSYARAGIPAWIRLKIRVSVVRTLPLATPNDESNPPPPGSRLAQVHPFP